MMIREYIYSFPEAQPVTEDIYPLFCRVPTETTITNLFIHAGILPEVWYICHINVPNERKSAVRPARGRIRWIAWLGKNLCAKMIYTYS
jgi:hypothetical protein